MSQNPSNAAVLAQAAEILDHDGVVGLPTETVYGLAARLDRPVGLQKIFQVKNRPFFDPLIVHVDSVAMAKSLVTEWSRAADILTSKFWPGPLTLILPKNEKVPEVVTSGLAGVGLRCPDHALALQLIAKVGPVAAPSANRFGRTSPTSWQHVEAEFGDQVFVLKDEAAKVGIESTVLRLEGESLALLRPGMITREDISSALASAGVSFHWQDNVSRAEAPGQMKHHYLPAVPLIWTEGETTEKELASQLEARRSELPSDVAGVAVPWAKSTALHFVRGAEVKLPIQPEMAARVLYSELRRAAESGVDFIYFRFLAGMTGERWAAVLERLTKATSIKLP